MSVGSSGSGAGHGAAAGSGLGVHSGCVVSRSSAVPVLPATRMPSIAAAPPVPSRTTDSIMLPTRRATPAGTTCLRSGGRPLSSVSRGRRPRPAIVAATHAICSAVACTLPWPIAEEPTASPSPISLAGGIVLVAAPGMPGSVLKPNCSAVLTRRSGPRRVPSGANTELHECAKDWRNVPPQDSPLAFSRSTPSRTAFVSTGYFEFTPASLCSSTPASVTILNVEPGGCRPEKAIPASARISPVRGRTTATPPRRAPFATSAARCTAGSIDDRTAVAGRGCVRASTRLPARSSPPGRPATRSSKTRSRPEVPTRASSG